MKLRGGGGALWFCSRTRLTRRPCGTLLLLSPTPGTSSKPPQHGAAAAAQQQESHPGLTSSSTAPRCPCSAARWSAVRPHSSRASTTPGPAWAHSSRMTAAWPRSAAECRGVPPWRWTASTLAPAASARAAAVAGAVVCCRAAGGSCHSMGRIINRHGFEPTDRAGCRRHTLLRPPARSSASQAATFPSRAA